MKFILTDSNVDRDSERILVDGLSIDNFVKNPVMLFQHRRDDTFWSGYEAPPPIGYWDNVKKENGQLTAEPVFNDTPLAQVVKSLVEHGTLRAASIGFRAISYSDDPALLLPGQKYATITQAELFEASIVDIPANPNAVVVKSYNKDGRKYEITGESKLSEKDLKAIADAMKQTPSSKNTIMSEIKSLLDSAFADLKKAMGVKSETPEAPAQEKTENAAEAKGEEQAKPAEEKPAEETIDEKPATEVKETEEVEAEKSKAIIAKFAEVEKQIKALSDENESLRKERDQLKAANLKLSGSQDPIPGAQGQGENGERPSGNKELTIEERRIKAAQAAAKAKEIDQSTKN